MEALAVFVAVVEAASDFVGMIAGWKVRNVTICAPVQKHLVPPNQLVATNYVNRKKSSNLFVAQTFSYSEYSKRKYE